MTFKNNSNKEEEKRKKKKKTTTTTEKASINLIRDSRVKIYFFAQVININCAFAVARRRSRCSISRSSSPSSLPLKRIGLRLLLFVGWGAWTRREEKRHSRNRWITDVKLTLVWVRLFVLIAQKKGFGHGQFEFQLILTLFQLRESLLTVGLLSHLEKSSRWRYPLSVSAPYRWAIPKCFDIRTSIV